MSVTNKKPTKVNEDLIKERKTCTFNTLELTHLIDGGPEATQKRKQQEKYFLDDPELMQGTPMEYLSHEEKYKEVIRKMWVLKKKRGPEGPREYYKILGRCLGFGVFPDGTPMDVHFGMFIPCIKSQGTKEQQEKWLPRAENCEILGTYAQTELGHGTFIRGLETTATYDPQTEQFVLNSPTLTAYKWWPASLGKTANHAVILAQLYSLGKCHGIHLFIVQLRDEETHQPLPGITVGEIGPKLGMNTVNNGYLGFKDVRIPRENMLMKSSQITKDGTYSNSSNSKLAYGTMVSIRVSIVEMTSELLKKCVTIAVRYSAVRRQSQQKPGEPESQIIDYLTQQYKLFPQIATFFAFHYTKIWITDVYNRITTEIERGNLNQLAELHALSSCLKAVTSADATAAVETCRLACGGHGYMMCSGFPNIYGLVTAMCTYEGENTVLLLQTARSLIKAWTMVLQGKPLAPIMQYLSAARRSPEKPFEKSVSWIIWALEKISARKIEKAWNSIDARTKKGISPEDAWNLTSIELVSAAEVYAKTFIVKIYSEMLSKTIKNVSLPLQKVMHELSALYSVYTVLNLRGDLLRFTDVDGATIEKLQEWLVELLGNIRPNAVGIVDSFDLRDELLSALGVYDGNVYEKLFEEAAKSPLNKEAVNKSFELYLKPLMRSNY